MSEVLAVISLITILLAVLPMIRSRNLWVRGFDFPRMQLLSINLVLLGLWYFADRQSLVSQLIIAGLILAALTDSYRIFPYTVLAHKESEAFNGQESFGKLSLLACNVKQTNRDYHRLIDLVAKERPDILLAVETDHAWADALDALAQDFPFSVKVPSSNTYGMLIYSRLPIKEHEVLYLVDDNVPSMRLVLDVDGNLCRLICLHPRPPRPQEADSTERDGELSQAALYLQKHQTLPSIAAGDFNDVAWSHSTRLFLRVSGLLDPRRGRGFFPTFPVYNPFLRFPLDHVFHSPHFRLEALQRLPDIGSDHFPFLAILRLTDKSAQPEPAQPEAVDEAEQLCRAAQDWDGPRQEVTEDLA